MPMTSRLVFGLLSCATVVACHKSSSDTHDNVPVETTAATIVAPAQAPPVVVNIPQEQPPAVNVTINNPPPQQQTSGTTYVTSDTNATNGEAPAAAPQAVAQPQQVVIPAYAQPQQTPQRVALPQIQGQGQQGQLVQPTVNQSTPPAAGYANGAANPPTNPAQPSGGYTGIGGGAGYTGVGGGSGYTGVGGGSGFTGIGGGGSSMAIDGG